MTNEHTTHLIATEFARLIKEWLTPEQYAKLVAEDRVNAESNANDYCDANQAVIDAFVAVIGREPRFPSDVEEGFASENEMYADFELLEAVWVEAKRIWTA